MTARWIRLGEIARGGLGVILAARNERTGAVGAMKVAREGTGDLGAERIRREATALAALRHPNVVRRLDAGTDETGEPFVVLELLAGRDLAGEVGRTSPERAAWIACEVLAGLEAAHEIGIVHRDVKPANVVACEDGSVKLVDFGIAHVPELRPIERPGGCVGSPRFMAPEQLSGGEPLDGRTDLYAVGLLLFELVAGRGPFDELRGSFAGLRYAHARLPPPRLSSLAPASTALDSVIDRALAKRPSDRFASARTMRLALGAYVPHASPHAGCGASATLRA